VRRDLNSACLQDRSRMRLYRASSGSWTARILRCLEGTRQHRLALAASDPAKGQGELGWAAGVARPGVPSAAGCCFV
jgi:hypothetical protein